MIEVADISNEEAEDLLTTVMPKHIASSIVNLIGGRLVQLAQALSAYSMFKNEEGDIVEKIKEEMISDHFYSCIDEALSDGNITMKMAILKAVMNKGTIRSKDLIML